MTTEKRIEQLVAKKDKRGYYFEEERKELITLLSIRSKMLTNTLTNMKTSLDNYCQALEDTNKHMLKLKAEQEEEDKVWKGIRREMFILEEAKEHRNLTEAEMRGLISLYNALIDKKKRELQELQPSSNPKIRLQKDWECLMLKKDRLEKELQAFIDEEKNKYYFISFKSGQLAFVTDTIDQHSLNDNSRYEKGNYFLTKEEAQEVAYRINYQFTQLNKPNRRPKK
jgi:hypothetical protein